MLTTPAYGQGPGAAGAATTNSAPYGEIPVAVATVCRITYYCERRDIHAKAEGYLIIAQLIADALPKAKKKK